MRNANRDKPRNSISRLRVKKYSILEQKKTPEGALMRV